MSSSSDELILKFVSECENKQIYKQKNPNKNYWEVVQSPEEKDFDLFSQV